MSFYDLGYDNFPSCRGYPTLDKFTPEDEKEYLEGWHRRKAELEQTQLDGPNGRSWMEEY